MNTSRRALRIVVVDDHPLMRKAVSDLLLEHGNEVVAQLDSAEGLLALVRGQTPDVVILDIRMPPTHTDEGLRAALALRRECPQVGVLLLCMNIDTRYARELLAEIGSEHGGIGYLLKERADGAEFVEQVRQIAAGGVEFDPRVVRRLLAAMRVRKPLDRLTRRETEVLQLMAQGFSNTAVATELFITDRAVEKHIGNIFTKLDIPVCTDRHRRILAVLQYLNAHT